jgi:hypothetical protein
MQKINDFFDCVYYINLDSREDRKDKFWSLNKEFLDEEKTVRIPAIDARNTTNCHDYYGIMKARTGISLSYLKPFRDAAKNKYNKILIFEDDAQPLFSNLSQFEKSIKDAEQNDYSIIFFGGSVQSKLLPHDDSLFKISGNILATQAVAYNNLSQGIFEEFLSFEDSFEWMIKFLISHGSVCMDTIIGEGMTKKYTTFLSNPLLFGQYSGHSDINAQEESYNSEMLERFEKFKC